MNTSFNVYAPLVLPRWEQFASGHRACQGCAEVLALRLVVKAAGPNTIVSSATGCMEIISSPYPHTAWKIPWIHVAFENAAAVASGVESGIKVLQRKGKIPRQKIYSVAMAGDGGTMDIGLQALSGALERGHDMLYVCFDNEAYMNTGIQRSSGTPYGAMTTTSPPGKLSIGQKTWKKDLPAIAAAHGVPYVATASPSYPFDLMEKVKRALETPGPAYIHIYSVCPTGWRSASDMSIRLGRLVVQTGIFPLYEVVDGEYSLSLDILPENLLPVEAYFKLQGRFRHLTPQDIQNIQARVRREYERLLEKAGKLRRTQ
ncbi:MAG: pyruvate synthase subunit beta [Deltaproteobacteria bacterium]|nr:pyruvate synthase subunit beta [Deltaproteobacteria bacterium]MBW2306014.1 pyruvate synthase subunit beta [Deltaproteobacteria bacterium]